MIDGFVNQYLEPIVPVTILDINQYRWRQEVVVDTGFDGDLTFPSEFIQQLGFTSAGETDMTLADGQTVKCNFIKSQRFGTGTIELSISWNPQPNPCWVPT